MIPPPVPWIDRVVGDRTGDVLAWLAKRAKARGDAHEFAHLYGAVVFGNSGHTVEWPCALGYLASFLDRRGEPQEFTVSLVEPQP